MTHEPTIGVILAGGRAERMGGGDKPLRMVGGRPLLTRVIEALQPQCDGLVLNANGDPARFAAFGLPVVPDTVADGGPLAGVLAGLDWVAVHRPEVRWMLSASGDCPFLPADLVARLRSARHAEGAEVVSARSGGQTHHVIGLWPVAMRDALRHALMVEGCRKVHMWTGRQRLTTVDWPVEPHDPFFNANRPEDLETADRIAAAL